MQKLGSKKVNELLSSFRFKEMPALKMRLGPMLTPLLLSDDRVLLTFSYKGGGVLYDTQSELTNALDATGNKPVHALEVINLDNFLNNCTYNINKLAIFLEVDNKSLEYTTKYSKLIDTKLKRFNYSEVFNYLYEPLIVYIGSCLITRVNGRWNIINTPTLKDITIYTDSKEEYNPYMDLFELYIENKKICNIESIIESEVYKYKSFN